MSKLTKTTNLTIFMGSNVHDVGLSIIFSVLNLIHMKIDGLDQLLCHSYFFGRYENYQRTYQMFLIFFNSLKHGDIFLEFSKYSFSCFSLR